MIRALAALLALAAPLPIPLDAPTQARCAAPRAGERLFSISLDPFKLTSFGDYPPAGDEVYFLPDTPYFHALWLEGLAHEFRVRAIAVDPGPLEKACVHVAERRPGDVYEAKDVPAGGYIMVVLVRRDPGVANMNGGFITVAPHAPSAGLPSARFFAKEIDVEEGSVARRDSHLMLVDEIP